MAQHEDLPSVPEPYIQAIKVIDEAHAQDPNLIDDPEGPKRLPYELHYARKMTRWLALHNPDAPAVLRVACRAQHFRRSVPSLQCSSTVLGIDITLFLILTGSIYCIDGNFLGAASQ